MLTNLYVKEYNYLCGMATALMLQGAKALFFRLFLEKIKRQ